MFSFRNYCTCSTMHYGSTYGKEKCARGTLCIQKLVHCLQHNYYLNTSSGMMHQTEPNYTEMQDIVDASVNSCSRSHLILMTSLLSPPKTYRISLVVEFGWFCRGERERGIGGRVW